MARRARSIAIAIAGIVSPMLAIAEPNARLRLVCTRSWRASRTAASVSGSSTSSAMTTPTADGGAPTASTPSSMAGDSILAQPDHRDERHAPAARGSRSVARSDGGVGVPLGVIVGRRADGRK